MNSGQVCRKKIYYHINHCLYWQHHGNKMAVVAIYNLWWLNSITKLGSFVCVFVVCNDNTVEETNSFLQMAK